MVKISVIVPIYNVEQYLERCLLSIKNQIFSAGAYEVILVDDGSTDNSSKIAKKFVEEDISKFVLVYEKNQGLSGARNRGILQASGKYISRGVSVDSLDTEKKWETHITVKEGDVIGAGTVIAETQETASILHKSMVPPTITHGTVIHAAPDGAYTVLEPIVTIRLNYMRWFLHIKPVKAHPP